MADLQIKPGTKLQLAFDAPVGKPVDFNMMATFREQLDEAYFLISVPMFAGKPLVLDENQKLVMRYTVGEHAFVLSGYPETLVKQGIRSFWKVRQVAEQRTFFKRKDERFKVSVHVEYLRDAEGAESYLDAMTVDVSAGGIAMFLNEFPEVGEALQVRMPTIRLHGERHEIPEQLGIVCWLRQAPKGSLYRNICGLQFRYADDLERESVKEYVAYMREKYKL